MENRPGLRHGGIDLAALTCQSVINDATPRLRPLTAPTGFDAPIQIAECADVLFLPNVLAKGQGVCLFRDTIIPIESILDAETLDFIRPRWPQSETGAAYLQPFDVAYSDQTVVILGNVFSRNFTHWLEEMFKVALLEAMGLRCLYVFADLPAFTITILQALGIEPIRMIHPSKPTLFRSALFTPAVTYDTLPQLPVAPVLLRQALLEPLAGLQSRFSKRLWLERGTASHNGGQTLNKDAVHACLADYGFDVVDMMDLSFQDQLITVKGAEILAFPHGSSLAHMLFVPPRTAIIECFAPDHVNPSLSTCRVLGHRYHQIVSRSHSLDPYAHKRDLVVDVEHLRLTLDHLTGNLPPLIPPVE